MRLSPWIIKFITIVIVPTLACTTYYTLNKIDQESGIFYCVALMAIPVLLLGIISMLRLISKDNVKKNRLWLCLSFLAVFVPAVFLSYVWW